MRPNDIEGAQVMLDTMAKDLSDEFHLIFKPEAAQTQAAPNMPLNAVNLRQQER
jgi:hypothetical protein